MASKSDPELGSRTARRYLLATFTVAAAGIALFKSAPAFAVEPDSTFSLELDPLAYALKGYGLLVAYQPIGRVRFTAGAFKVGELPSLITNDGDNRNWKQGLYGFAGWANFFWNPTDRGVNAGLLFERRFHTYTNTDFPGQEAKQGRTDLIPTLGYFWQPFDLGFYALPWFGVALPLSKRTDVVVGGRKYIPRKVDYFITSHFGWEF